MVTTNGDDAVHLFFWLVAHHSLGQKVFGWIHPLVSVWNFFISAFLASVSCVSCSYWEQLAFLLGAFQRRMEIGLSLAALMVTMAGTILGW